MIVSRFVLLIISSDVTIHNFVTISIHRYIMCLIYGTIHFGTIHMYIDMSGNISLGKEF